MKKVAIVLNGVFERENMMIVKSGGGTEWIFRKDSTITDNDVKDYLDSHCIDIREVEVHYVEPQLALRGVNLV